MKPFLVPGFLLVSAVGAVLLSSTDDSRNQQIVKGQPIEDHYLVPAPVASIISRSCMDCHSFKTRWPIYSRLPIVGSMVEEDVRKGRLYLNFSRWNELKEKGREEESAVFTAICENSRMAPMAPKRYLAVHPAARLSESDIERVCGWAEKQATAVLAFQNDN